MVMKIITETKKFSQFLLGYQEEWKDSVDPVFYEDELQIQITGQGSRSPLRSFWSGNQPAFICERAVPTPASEGENVGDCLPNASLLMTDEEVTPLPLSVLKARQVISRYVLSQNPNVPQLAGAGEPGAALYPLWVRCDMSDPEGTCWLGADAIRSGSKVTAVNLHTVTCKGPAMRKETLITLDELKQAHKSRHHASTVATRGCAQYDLFGSTVVENTVIESQSSVTVDFTWNSVESILQTPPLTSTATLNIKVTSGDMRSPVYQLYKELEFIQVLAEGLRTGVTEWPEPLETNPAVELTKALIEDLRNKVKSVQNQSAKEKEPKKEMNDSNTVDGSIRIAFLTERGDLDFVEQLWSKMRKSVTSYQDIVDCLTLVIQALKFGDIQPWIHRGSSSSLSKLVLQSYHGQMGSVSLTGLTPVHMLLEVGLDKMRKDYINYFIGQELSTLNYLSYYLSSEVDLQEQVERLKKLHHLLEIVVNCSTFLSLSHQHLFPLTQSCLQFYKTHPYDEDHSFQLQIRPTVISSFYQKEHPQTWRVEVSSGHGPQELKTTWQLSDKPPVDHVAFNMADVPFEVTVNGENEEPMYFTTVVSCSQVSFT
nr:PREDICTED: protein zwilch homolog [Lepisosteus oculatus]XP_015198638.1 PREDICTED: protein zwilch homolog [Lepisosteus oculatus]XP_015198639.1 PREDICTED: protein zwilch homolog [Lepisosteus oculatus]XP_015198640.1 PREDICTED: protein zwilch homolog [Lepisosteus oculatus]